MACSPSSSLLLGALPLGALWPGWRSYGCCAARLPGRRRAGRPALRPTPPVGVGAAVGFPVTPRAGRVEAWREAEPAGVGVARPRPLTPRLPPVRLALAPLTPIPACGAGAVAPAGEIDAAGPGVELVPPPRVAVKAARPPSNAQTTTMASTTGALRPGPSAPPSSQGGAVADGGLRDGNGDRGRRRAAPVPLNGGAEAPMRPSPSDAGIRITRVRGGSVDPGDPDVPDAPGRPSALDDGVTSRAPVRLGAVPTPAEAVTPWGITLTVGVSTALAGACDGASDGVGVPDC